MLIFKTFTLCCLWLSLTQIAFSQTAEMPKKAGHFGGAVTVTNNGISVIPTFTLGKPAAIFDMSVGRKKLSFEPQMRFALEGKPWSFIFWWRYKLLNTKRWSIGAGAHPSLVFRNKLISTDSASGTQITAVRYLAGELAPNYRVSKNFSVGMYYLYAHGLDKGTTHNTNFLTINCNFSHIPVRDQFYLRFSPQLYYLKMDQYDGFYVTATLSVLKQGFPLQLSFMGNKVIKTSISTSKDFVWNASLVYVFNRKYAEIQ
jgi:hypothetical protein